MKKLSKVQAEILELLQNGWEAGTSNSLDPRSWIQEGGVGRGGKAQTVNYRTLHALSKAGYLKLKQDYPTMKWELLTPEQP